MTNSKFRALIILLLSAACFTAVPALRADDTNSAPAMKGMKDRQEALKKIFAKLNLSDDQKPKVRAAFQAQQEKFRDMMQDTSLTKDEKKEQAKTIIQNTETKLKSILTPDQYAKWQELRKTLPQRAMGDGKLPDSEKTPLLPVK